MSTDWKKQYKKSMAWDYDTYLLNANTGTKVCSCCNEVRFSVEFPNVDEFTDHKLPVCLDCFRRSDGSGKETVGLYDGCERICKECKRLLTLDNFAYRKNGNKLSDTCRDCVGTYEFNQ